MPERSITEMDEMDVRMWFAKIPLEQARDTYRVVEGILQVRMEAQPEPRKRKKRSDSGLSRDIPDQASEDRRLFESTQD